MKNTQHESEFDEFFYASYLLNAKIPKKSQNQHEYIYGLEIEFLPSEWNFFNSFGTTIDKMVFVRSESHSGP